ncbi:dihydrolipoamide acetyltransferase family protein, partial [Streptomyces sp. NPDC058307]|uniref:dihydrolipoamide acetyltransferase family protein n=1 Tax=Streptomyces sp. NPDC058307 TaxID=3346439 RepID=UPI0036EC3DC7
MAQVLEFRLPDLGEGLTEAEIVRWLVEVGDVVAVDQPVVEVETAKAMVDVPCPYAGVVTARFGEEGSELPVGSPLITVAVGAPASDPDARAEGSGNVLVGYGTSEAPARRRRVRREQQVPVPVNVPVNGSPASPEVVEGPVPVISPLVRRLARENGLDLRELTGSGPDGLILRADVEYALRAAASHGRPAAIVAPEAPEAPEAPRNPATTSAATPAGTRVPLKGVRGAVADKLSRSRSEIPDATCWVDADATELMRARAAMNATGGPKISLLALLARICTAALARFPELNSTVDMAAREI